MYSKKPQSREWRRKNTKGHDFQEEKVSERFRDGRNHKIRNIFFWPEGSESYRDADWRCFFFFLKRYIEFS